MTSFVRTDKTSAKTINDSTSRNVSRKDQRKT